MGNKEFKTRLADALCKGMPEIDEVHLEKTICLAQCVYRERKCRQRIGFWRMLLRQVKFMGMRVWGIQAILLLFILGIFHTFMGSTQFMVRHISYILCAVTVIMLWVMMPVIARSLKYKMYEIENASLFSGSRLLLAQMMIIAGGVIAMFSVLLWFAKARYSFGMNEVVCSIILPSFVSGNLYLYLLRHVRPQRFLRACNLTGIILLAVIGIMDRRVLSLVELPAVLSWGGCFLGLAFCAVQVRGLWKQTAVEK